MTNPLGNNYGLVHSPYTYLSNNIINSPYGWDGVDDFNTSFYYEMWGFGGNDIFEVGTSTNLHVGPFTAGWKMFNGGDGIDSIWVSVPVGQFGYYLFGAVLIDWIDSVEKIYGSDPQRPEYIYFRGHINMKDVQSISEIDMTFGSKYSDQYEGSSFVSERVSGEGGDDLLMGNGGDDILFGDFDVDHRDPSVEVPPVHGNDDLYGGAGNDRLYGNDGMDYLSGDDGNDFLDGGKGSDILVGGAGKDILIGGENADYFIFGADAPIDPKTNTADYSWLDANLDVVKDFVHGEDKVVLSMKAFGLVGTEGGQLASKYFLAGAYAKTVDQHILYDKDTGDLWYDPNGSDSFNGWTGRRHIANFTDDQGKHPLALDVSDFLLVA